MSYIGNSPGVASQRIVNSFVATAGQTTFTPSSGYSLGYVDVFQNGAKLVAGDDFTATNGSTVVLTTAAASGDSVEVVAYIPRGLSDGYLKSEADARFLNLAGGQLTSNLGIGVAPAAWGSNYKALQVGQTAGLYSYGTNAYLSNNFYNDSSNTARYIATNYASLLMQQNGAFKWLQAPSGNAGDAATFTQSMTLDTSGNLLIGQTSSFGAQWRLQLYNASNTDNRIQLTHSGSGNTGADGLLLGLVGADSYVYNYELGSIIFGTNNAERVRIDSSGNVGVGIANPGAKLEVSTGGSTNATAMLIGPSSGTATVGDKITLGFKLQNTAGGNTGNAYAAAIAAIQDKSASNSGSLGFYTQSQAGDGTPERMRITSVGKVIIGNVGTSSDRLFIVDTGGAESVSSVFRSNGAASNIGFRDASTSNDYTVMVGCEGNALKLSSGNGTERARLDDTGNLCVGTTASGSYRISLSGNNSTNAIGIRMTDVGTNGRTFGIRSDYGSFVIGDATAGATRMSIDANGAVTKLNQPCFYAYSPTNTSSGGLKIWQSTRVNRGNCYNTSTGLFTAPVAGIYFFATNLHINNTAGPQAQFRINGSDVMELKAQLGSNFTYITLTAAIAIPMAANDTFSVYLANGTITSVSEQFSSFSGYLLG